MSYYRQQQVRDRLSEMADCTLLDIIEALLDKEDIICEQEGLIEDLQAKLVELEAGL